MNRRSRTALATALALTATLLGYWLFIGRPKAPPEPLAEPRAEARRGVNAAPVAEAARARDQALLAEQAREADPSLPINHRLRGRDAGNLVKNFDLSSVYPANVRLLRSNQRHLIEPDRYQGDLTPAPLPSLRLTADDKSYAQKLADEGASRAEIRDRMKARKGIEQLPRYRLLVTDNNLTAGESFFGLLEVVAESGAPVPHTLVSARVFADPAFGGVALGAARVLAGIDGKTPIEWAAPSQDEIYWGDLRLELEIGIGNETVPLVHRFYSTPFAGVQFNGKFSAAAVAGSFLFEAGLRVQRPGRCVFSVLLYDDARNEPIARATHVDVFEAGTHAVAFSFHGKVFHDADFRSGRLALRELRGECTRHDVQRGQLFALDIDKGSASRAPEQFHVPTLARAYVTDRPFSVGEFTSKPWQSPEKERQRELLVMAQSSREEQRSRR